jgi:ferric-dicitrate binding protein FerR (iron transport regulator)
VKTRQSDIEVLGTSFNIKAYDNEASEKTTLIEGKIKITGQQSADQRSAILSPGQQATCGEAAIQVVDNANLDQVMAWRNGLFNFEGASLKEIMQQIERWYDVEVVYEGEMPVKYFEGQMRQDMSLSEVIKALTQTGVRFKMEEGKKLVIVKQ